MEKGALMYSKAERLEFLKAAWVVFAFDPIGNRTRLEEIEYKVGQLLDPIICSDFGNPVIDRFHAEYYKKTT